MLKVLIERELFDEKTNKIIKINKNILLEHSLCSIAKWESKWKKSFISTKEKSSEMIIDYIRCMCLNDDDCYLIDFLTTENLNSIIEYLGDSQTALTFKDSKPSNEIITSEKIYYWMFSSGIDISCEKWNISRLMALLRYIGEKSEPPKKMSKAELAMRNNKLNAERRKRLKTKG